MSQAQHGLGLMAACVLMRDLASGSVDCCVCSSVLDAFNVGVERLTQVPETTAIVVAGEHESPAEIQLALSNRANAIAERLEQSGLFLTLAAQDIVRDKLRMDARFEDFGVVDTDDPGRAERIFAVIHPDLPEPALPHKRVAGNCPRLHRSFIGRHRQTDELQNLILQRSLVTLIGAPGVGKTATAIHVARSFGDEYEDGAWWFSVEDRASVDELIQAMARERGFLSLRGPVDEARLAAALAGKKAIVVLDGCETMIDGISRLSAEIVEHAKSLTLLLTSTKPLGLADEYIYRIEPLTLPEQGDYGEDALIGSEALALFFERAAQAGLQFALDEKNIALATTICEKVDGLPVAIELVAASLRTSSLELLAMELSSDLVPLSAKPFGPFDRAPVEEALRLSYKSLSAGLRSGLSRLALFRGEWRISEAGDLWGGDFDPSTLLALHQELANSSWLAFNPDRNTYHMLHTLRSFAWEKAGSSAPNLLAQFGSGMARLAARIFSELPGASGLEAEQLLSRHYSDLVFAVDASIDASSAVASVLMQYMVQFWLQRNFLDDALRISSRFGEQATGIDKARALVMIGVVHLRVRRLTEAVDAFQQCLDLAREAGNPVAEATALSNLGLASQDRGDYAEALQYYAKAASILRESKHYKNLCAALCNAADAEIKIARAAPAADRDAHVAAAELLVDQATELASELDPLRLQALWHASASLALARNQTQEAESFLLRAVAICARHGLRHEAGEAAEILAEINLVRGLGPTAAKLLGLSRQIRRESGKTRTEAEMQYFGGLVTQLYEQVDRDRAEKLMRYGERLDLAEILTPIIFSV